ncbi:MAG: hypothetical protein KBS70_06940 [Bacteroidales bacterium]|nr:hypothetical protein [Candidatus Colicola equi]
MNKTLILNKLQQYKNFQNLADFAAFLGIELKQLYAWRTKNRYNLDLLRNKFPEVSAAWLMTGEGSMLASGAESPRLAAEYTVIEEPIPEVDRAAQIDALCAHFGGGSTAQLARLLHILPQSISGWRTRNTIDIERCHHYLPGLSASWLITGEGEMLVGDSHHDTTATSHPDDSATPAAIEAMTRIIKEQADEIAFLKGLVRNLQEEGPTRMAAENPWRK